MALEMEVDRWWVVLGWAVGGRRTGGVTKGVMGSVIIAMACERKKSS